MPVPSELSLQESPTGAYLFITSSGWHETCDVIANSGIEFPHRFWGKDPAANLDEISIHIGGRRYESETIPTFEIEASIPRDLFDLVDVPSHGPDAFTHFAQIWVCNGVRAVRRLVAAKLVHTGQWFLANNYAQRAYHPPQAVRHD